MNSTSVAIIAAAISLAVGIITFFGTVLAAKQQVVGQGNVAKLQIEGARDVAEQQIKGQLEVAHRQIRAQLDEVIQSQFKDILSKRIEVYPELWQILQTSLSDRIRTGEPVNSQWAQQLFRDLLAWHAQNGVFLTQDSYSRFSELRTEVTKIYQNCEKGQQPTNGDLGRLDVILSGTDNKSGLATELKNDLGSYKVVAVSVGPSSQQSAAQ